VEPLPDLASLPDPELRELIAELKKEEDELSYKRRILHGKIDILRAELVARLQRSVGDGEGTALGADLERLTDILAAKAPPPDDAS
jgi:pheromone shutdown protein TraB